MNKWTKLLLMTILIAGLVVGMSNALPTRAAPGEVLYRINAGGGTVGGWSEDAFNVRGGTLSTPAAIDTTGMPAYAIEAIFQTHRWTSTPGLPVIYSLPLAPGVTEVDVNLFFAEIATNGDEAGWRIFDILIEGVEVTSNLDVFVASGGQYNAHMISYNAVEVTDGTLNIAFARNVPDTRAAMISAIEVIEGGEATQVPTQVPTDVPTDEPTGEPTDEPTVEPTEPPIVIPDMFCSLDDGSLNALHCGRPVAIYDEGSFEIFGIDINTGNGTLAFVMTDEQIAAAGVPADVPVVIATGENPYNFRPIVLYRLPSGEFQLNTYYWDGKPYSVKWDEGASTVEVVTW